MATQDDVRRLAMALPGVSASPTGFAFSVEVKGKDKGFAWVWQERVHPDKPRVPNPLVLAVRVVNQTEKAALLGADANKFFTEPHYNGFPAVLVRLPAISPPELGHLLAEAWRCMAPKPLVAAYDAGDTPPPAALRARSAPATRSASPKPPASSTLRPATATPPGKPTATRPTSSTRPKPTVKPTSPSKPTATRPISSTRPKPTVKPASSSKPTATRLTSSPRKPAIATSPGKSRSR